MRVVIQYDYYGKVEVAQYDGVVFIVLGRYSHLLNAIWEYPEAEIQV